jgi:hypothetical protein
MKQLAIMYALLLLQRLVSVTVTACGVINSWIELQRMRTMFPHSMRALADQGPWCCEKGKAAGVKVCAECEELWSKQPQ